MPRTGLDSRQFERQADVAFAELGARVTAQLGHALGVVEPPPGASASDRNRHRFVCALLANDKRGAKEAVLRECGASHPGGTIDSTPSLVAQRAHDLAAYAISALRPFHTPAELRILLGEAFNWLRDIAPRFKWTDGALDMALAQLEYEECRDRFSDLNLDINMGLPDKEALPWLPVVWGARPEGKASLMATYESSKHAPALLDYVTRLSRVTGFTFREVRPLLMFMADRAAGHARSHRLGLHSECLKIAAGLEAHRGPGDMDLSIAIRRWLDGHPFGVAPDRRDGRPVYGLPYPAASRRLPIVEELAQIVRYC